RDIAKGLIGREKYLDNPGLVRAQEGFSLLDLKRYVDARGYQGIGYGKLDLDDLIVRAQIIVSIRSNGFLHCVVVLMRRDKLVLVVIHICDMTTFTVNGL